MRLWRRRIMRRRRRKERDRIRLDPPIFQDLFTAASEAASEDSASALPSSESESITGSCWFPPYYSIQEEKNEISSLGIWEWIIIEEVIWELYSTVGCFPTCLNVISDCFEVKVEKQYFCQLDHVSSQIWSAYMEIRVQSSFLFLAGNHALRD